GLGACGNPVLIKRALLNLVNNALEASPAGTVLALSCRPSTPPAVEFLVRDPGRGVPGCLSPRRFQPLVTGRQDGAGRGLAAVRAVARAHGGEVWYAPVEGGGSLFGLRLPVRSMVAERLAVNA